MDHGFTTSFNHHPKSYGDKWEINTSWNYGHKSLFTNQLNTFPITIEWMPSKGLAKTKSQLAPRAWTTNLRMWLTATLKHN